MVKQRDATMFLPPFFLGLDLGTSGLRAVVLDRQGAMVTRATSVWIGQETRPDVWLQHLESVVLQVGAGIPRGAIAAVSACSTSGTILAVDAEGSPLTAAWLYADHRGAAEAKELGIPLSWGLTRWLWWHRHYPVEARHSRLAHAADWVIQRLGGDSHVTDHTSALKSGFDLVTYRWPIDWLLDHGLESAAFPQVVPPGTVVGTVPSEWGLGDTTLAVAGLTDGCAAQLAAGAVETGQVSTSLGTTLIFKATADTAIQVPDGSVYAHLHPDRNAWLVGAASSTGGGVLPLAFPEAQFAMCDQEASLLQPTGIPCYPLMRPGERFPFTAPTWPGINPPLEPGSLRYYRALLEGIACVERLGLERLGELGIPYPDQVLTTGGAAASPLWLRIRASILQRPLILSRYPEPAVGAAMVAAAGFWRCPVREAVTRLWQPGAIVAADPEWVPTYARHYQEFCAQDLPKG